MPKDIASDECCMDAQFGHQYEYSIVGENGSLHFLPLQGICRIYRHEPQKNGSMLQRFSRTVKFPNYNEAIHNGNAQMAQFLEAVGGESPSFSDPRDALQTHLVCFAAAEALQTELPVSSKLVFETAAMI